MKKILLLLIFNSSLLTLNCYSQQYGWVVLNPASISGTPNLSDLFFINADTGWINSNTVNSIFYTEDGAGSFVTQSIASTIDAIHMSDANNDYAAADDGSIYRTTNGGANWNYLAPTFTNLNDITFPLTGSTATGYACGDNGAIYSVTSLGANVMTSGVVSNLKSITFPTATQGWTCGQSVILHFASGTWHGDQAYPSGTYNAIYFTDNQKGWAIGTKIIHTTDGQNWIEQTNPDTLGRTLVNVFFLNENEGWIVGNQGLILHTTNGGTTWTVEANGLTNTLLTGVQFTSSTNGYVVGNNKTLLKYTQLTTGVEHELEDLKFEIFPNPAAGKFKVQSSKFKVEEAKLEIYDLNGRKLLEKQIIAGTNNSEIDVSQLKSGVYFCRLLIEKYSATQKLIIQN